VKTWSQQKDALLKMVDAASAGEPLPEPQADAWTRCVYLATHAIPRCESDQLLLAGLRAELSGLRTALLDAGAFHIFELGGASFTIIRTAPALGEFRRRIKKTTRRGL
jgi:hypothetical protein